MEEELKIIHFPVARGDCTLIMIHAQDGSPEKSWHIVSILIDTGKIQPRAIWEAIWKEITDEYARLQKNYPPEKQRKPRLNYFIISHFDEDHFKWADSFLEVLRKNREQEKGTGNEWQWVDELYIVDRIAALPIDISRADLGVNEDLVRYEYPRDDKNGIPKAQATSYLKTVRGYRPYADKNIRLREGDDLLQKGQTYRLPSFQMLCLAANGFIAGALAAQRQGDEVPKPGKPAKERFFDENDLSFAFLLSFGTFRYYTGGDLTGSHDPDLRNVKNGMEKPLVDYLKGTFIPKATDDRRPDFHACVVLLHHHGSKRSTLGDFLDYFKPRIAVCSADGKKIKRNRHPSTEVIQRLRGQEDLLYESPDPPPPEKKRFRRRPCTLLCTFRLTNKGFEEPSRVDLKDLSREDWNIAGAPLQDVILHVIAEKDHSPLVKGEKPRIRILRRLRPPSMYLTPSSEEPYQTDDSVVNGICDCDGDHNHAIFRLQTGIPQP